MIGRVSALKGAGYGTSTLSVVLLGIVSLKAALESPLLIACLCCGMLTSVLGMFLRWRSHRLEQAEKQHADVRPPHGGYHAGP